MTQPIVMPNVTVGPEDQPKPTVLPNVTVGPQEDINADLAQLRAIAPPAQPVPAAPVGLDAVLEAANRVAQPARTMQSFQRTVPQPPYTGVTPEMAAQFAPTQAAQPAPQAPTQPVGTPPGGGGLQDPYTAAIAAARDESERLNAGVQVEKLLQTNQQHQEAKEAGKTLQAMNDADAREVDELKRQAQGYRAQQETYMKQFVEGKVDPTRLMRNKTTAQKLLGLASAISGGILLGMGRTQTNQALDAMEKEIDQDNLEQQREIVAKLQASREAGASANDVMKAMDMVRVLGTAKREAFWKSYTLKLDEIGMSHKGAIDKGMFDYIQNELKLRGLEAAQASLRASIAAAANQRRQDRLKAEEQAFELAKETAKTAGAEPFNVSLGTEQLYSARRGEPLHYKNPKTGKAELLPGMIAVAPSGEGAMKETAIKEHEKEAKVEDMATRFNKLDKLYQDDTAAFGQITGLGDTGHEINQNESAIVKDMMRVGLTSDKDAARILGQISRGKTQSRESWLRGVADTMVSEYQNIANPRDRERAAIYINNVFQNLGIGTK